MGYAPFALSAILLIISIWSWKMASFLENPLNLLMSPSRSIFVFPSYRIFSFMIFRISVSVAFMKSRWASMAFSP